jgi:hypothetical protein
MKALVAVNPVVGSGSKAYPTGAGSGVRLRDLKTAMSSFDGIAAEEVLRPKESGTASDVVSPVPLHSQVRPRHAHSEAPGRQRNLAH